jgi:TfoX/Sxy family transcriptional regulator of competence genes
MAYDPALAQTLRQALPPDLKFTEKRMMGGLCVFLNGNMVAGADRTKTGDGRFMFRVGKENEAQALMRPGASVVDLGGRRMGA